MLAFSESECLTRKFQMQCLCSSERILNVCGGKGLSIFWIWKWSLWLILGRRQHAVLSLASPLLQHIFILTLNLFCLKKVCARKKSPITRACTPPILLHCTHYLTSKDQRGIILLITPTGARWKGWILRDWLSAPLIPILTFYLKHTCPGILTLVQGPGAPTMLELPSLFSE